MAKHRSSRRRGSPTAPAAPAAHARITSADARDARALLHAITRE